MRNAYIRGAHHGQRFGRTLSRFSRQHAPCNLSAHSSHGHFGLDNDSLLAAFGPYPAGPSACVPTEPSHTAFCMLKIPTPANRPLLRPTQPSARQLTVRIPSHPPPLMRCYDSAKKGPHSNRLSITTALPRPLSPPPSSSSWPHVHVQVPPPPPLRVDPPWVQSAGEYTHTC
ncbi:hypothetical protein ACJQWK_05101 [Exserohilum turcicum]